MVMVLLLPFVAVAAIMLLVRNALIGVVKLVHWHPADLDLWPENHYFISDSCL